ncbi:MAG: hypothetical protein JNG89_03420, partial [Planctomycetaceae bacterium]|nr:hypothetical protein [Planctomycetaceae bacterium]
MLSAMPVHEGESRHSFAAWESAVRAAEPAVLFVEPRILRRVIKQDRRLTGIGFQVPHAHVYTIERERLLVIAERPELDLSPAAELPRSVILLPRAEMDDAVASLTTDEALHWYWRQLFHARVHIALEEHLAARRLDDAEIDRRIHELEAGAFEEIRHVLVKDDLLPPVHTESAAYIEFAAVALELKWFAPNERQYVFPAIDNWQEVDALLGRDVPHEALYQRTRPAGAPEHLRKSNVLQLSDDEIPAYREVAAASGASSPRSLRLAALADRAARMGNHVRAAILRMRGARHAFPERAREYRVAALRELELLVERLADLLQLSRSETAEWLAALGPLLEPASAGFRRMEARLLYDLQTACISQERGVYRLRLWRWVRSRGREPLRRALPLLQQVMIAKSLRSASSRAATVRLEGADRHRLEALLDRASGQIEAQFRDTVRPDITAVLDKVGLVPQNVPERVSRRKLVEELLDRIVERGFINLGDLRDALSQSDLKLSDLSGVSELILGDPLLRADRELAARLEGVYRPGTVNLRMPQRLSSLAFGTPVGRWLTQYIVLPFGGAYLALEAIRHVAHWFDPPHPEGFVGPTQPSGSSAVATTVFYTWVFFVGMMLMLVLHRPRFRAALGRVLTRGWKLLRHLVVDLPAAVLRAPWVQRVLQSQAWGVLRNYVLRPAVATLLGWGMARALDYTWSRDLAAQVFLAADLFLNTPIGRYAEEWLTDLLVRAWHELRIRVLAALFHWVMDVFHQLLQWVERIIYAVDEWLRFRSGDPRSFVAVKLVLGAVWSVFAYVIRFCMTLLVEPQVNPIKHFPVVTVSHKIIFPYTLTLSRLLQPLIGPIWAPTLATTIILLLPGVFGFLVWELKGNWRLYRANRPTALVPMPVGRHGETVVALVRPGFHSGTLPKLFARLREALHDTRRSEHGRAARKQLAALQGVETAVRRFVSRTLCELLRETGFQEGREVTVGQVRLATNRIDVELSDPLAETDSAWLRIEDLSGWLTGQLQEAGWTDRLANDERLRLNAALAGLYKRAGVDLVWDQLDATLGEDVVPRALTSDGIIVADRRAPGFVASYNLRTTSRRLLPDGASPDDDAAWPALSRDDVVFAEHPLDWDKWIATWNDAANGEC